MWQLLEGHLVELRVHISLNSFQRLVGALGNWIVRPEAFVENAERTTDPRRSRWGVTLLLVSEGHFGVVVCCLRVIEAQNGLEDLHCLH